MRHEITPRCGPGLAAGGLWGRQAGARVRIGTGQRARDAFLAGLRGCRAPWDPGARLLFPAFSSYKPQTQGRSTFFPAFSSFLV